MKKLITLLILVVTALTSSAQVQLRGSDEYVGWGGQESTTFATTDNNIYTLDWTRGNLSGIFKIFDGSWWGQGPASMKLGDKATLSTSGGDISFSGDNLNNIRFTYNKTTHELSITEIPVSAETVYRLYGNLFTNGNTDSATALAKDDNGVWYIERSGWEPNSTFVVEKVTGTTINATYGSTSPAVTFSSSVLTTTAVEVAEGANATRFNSNLDGKYKFEFDPSNNNITITHIANPTLAESEWPKVQMHGQILGVTTWQSYDMVTTDGWIYTLDPSTLDPAKEFSAGEFGIKVNGVWHAASGTNNVTEADTKYSFQSGGTNFKSTLTGKYILTLDRSTMKLKFATPKTSGDGGGGSGGGSDKPTQDPISYRINGNLFNTNATDAEVVTRLSEQGDGSWKMASKAKAFNNRSFVIEKVRGTEVLATYGAADASTVFSFTNNLATLPIDSTANVKFNSNFECDVVITYNPKDKIVSVKQLFRNIWIHGQISQAGETWLSEKLSTTDGVTYTKSFENLVAGEFGIKETSDEDGKNQTRWLNADGTFEISKDKLTGYKLKENGSNFKSSLTGPYTLSVNIKNNTLEFKSDAVETSYSYKIVGNVFTGNETVQTNDLIAKADGTFTLTSEEWNPNTTFNIEQYSISTVDNVTTETKVATFNAGASKIDITAENLANIDLVKGGEADFGFTMFGKFKLTLTPSEDGSAAQMTFEQLAEETPEHEANLIYVLRGTMFGDQNWGDYGMTKNTDGTWYFDGVDWKADSKFGIKIADKNAVLNQDNQKAWFAGYEATTIDGENMTGIRVKKGNDAVNFTNNLTGAYRITFNPTNRTISFTVNEPTYTLHTFITEKTETTTTKTTLATVKMTKNADGTYTAFQQLEPCGIEIILTRPGAEAKTIQLQSDVAGQTAELNGTKVYQMSDNKIWRDLGMSHYGDYTFTFNPGDYKLQATQENCEYRVEGSMVAGTEVAFTKNTDTDYTATAVVKSGDFVIKKYKDGVLLKTLVAPAPIEWTGANSYRNVRKLSEGATPVASNIDGDFIFNLNPATRELSFTVIRYQLRGTVEDGATETVTRLQRHGDGNYYYPEHKWFPGNVVIDKTHNDVIVETYKLTSAIDQESPEQQISMATDGTVLRSDVEEKFVEALFIPESKTLNLYINGNQGVGSGVEDLLGSEGEVEYYTLQGVKVSKENLTAGMYIVKKGAKTAKVMVK